MRRNIQIGGTYDEIIIKYEDFDQLVERIGSCTQTTPIVVAFSICHGSLNNLSNFHIPNNIALIVKISSSHYGWSLSAVEHFDLVNEEQINSLKDIHNHIKDNTLKIGKPPCINPVNSSIIP